LVFIVPRFDLEWGKVGDRFEQARDVLRPAIAVGHQGFAWRSFLQGVFARIERQVASKEARNPSADDDSREHIDDEVHVTKMPT
jgi:hypothetical protein